MIKWKGSYYLYMVVLYPSDCTIYIASSNIPRNSSYCYSKGIYYYP